MLVGISSCLPYCYACSASLTVLRCCVGWLSVIVHSFLFSKFATHLRLFSTVWFSGGLKSLSEGLLILWMFLFFSECFLIFLNVFEFFWMLLNVSERFWIVLNVSVFFSEYFCYFLDVFHFFWMLFFHGFHFVYGCFFVFVLFCLNCFCMCLVFSELNCLLVPEFCNFNTVFFWLQFIAEVSWMLGGTSRAWAMCVRVWLYINVFQRITQHVFLGLILVYLF